MIVGDPWKETDQVQILVPADAIGRWRRERDMITLLDSACDFGTTQLPNATVRFCLWAPAQQTVSVALEGGDLLPMSRSPNGRFEPTGALADGTRYSYQLADSTTVPDPASRCQADDVHGPRLVYTAPYAWQYPEWRGRPWIEVVLYEVHVGLAGGFLGVQEDLPRLKQLGVTVIELMPVNEFPAYRNWGYDGVLPYASDRAYGTPEDLKQLIDAARGLGLMIFLDVVYSHFGPDGNYLGLYAQQFFRDDVKTPCGSAIDFRRSEVRNHFTCNVLMWLMEYRVDGLRFDVVHAIHEQDWVEEMAGTVRVAIGPARHVHLVPEHHNAAELLRTSLDAQWNDDGHNVLHVLLTSCVNGYYADYSQYPASKLARVLSEGWVYQGERSAYLGKAWGKPSAHLPPYAHVLFLQYHDQIGNRGFGERLTVLAPVQALEAAVAFQMLCPQIPRLLMGEKGASMTPFLFFTDHQGKIADAVLKGRCQEFAGFAEFADPDQRERIPDPNDAGTFSASIPRVGAGDRFALFKLLIELRMREIVPRLAGTASAGAEAIGPKAVLARWHMGDRSTLTIVNNLGGDPMPFITPSGRMLFSTGGTGPMTAAYLEIFAE